MDELYTESCVKQSLFRCFIPLIQEKLITENISFIYPSKSARVLTSISTQDFFVSLRAVASFSSPRIWPVCCYSLVMWASFGTWECKACSKAGRNARESQSNPKDGWRRLA